MHKEGEAIIANEHGKIIAKVGNLDVVLEALIAYQKMLITSEENDTPKVRAKLIILHIEIDDIVRQMYSS
jgi:hypothetical protein